MESSVVQDAQEVAAGGDIVELRRHWDYILSTDSFLMVKERLNKKCQAIKKIEYYVV